jgi:hypothetical protein
MAKKITYSLNNRRSPGSIPFKTSSNAKTNLSFREKLMPESLYEQKRMLGHCFRHGERFIPSHQYKKKNLNMMEGEEEEDDDEERGGEEYFLEVNKGVNNGIMDEED